MNNEQLGTSNFLSVLVRLMGLALLLIGLFIGVKIIFEAWNLYEEPERIERFAVAVEKGSNLDSLLASLTPKLASKLAAAPVIDGKQQTENQREPLRISYFLAWLLAILLLMLIGSLASRAIKTGGELALYDLQVKRFATLIMKEIRQADKD